MAKDTKYTISESFELPSKGLIYNQSINPVITLRSMTARDELKRLNPTTTPLKTLADIIEDCIVDEIKVPVYQLALGDYEFLLHKLRVLSYGADYDIAYICPYCGKSFNTKINLDQLKVKEFDLETFNSLVTLDLPQSKHTIKLAFQTPAILDSIDQKEKEYKKRAPNAPINFNIYSRLLYAIEEVDGRHISSTEFELFIDSLPARDLNKILNRIDKLNSYLGIDTSVTLTCPNCNENVESFFRFGPEFFRPTDD